MARIKTSQDLRIIAAETIDKVLRGEVTPEQAGAVAKLGGLMLKTAIEEAKYRPENSLIEFFEDDEPISQAEEPVIAVVEKQKKLEETTKPIFNWEDCGKLWLGQWQVRGSVYKAETSIHGDGKYCLKVQLGLTNPEPVGEAFDAETMQEAANRAESFAIEHAKSRGLV